MMSKRPPAFASWLLKHFGCGPNTEAVLGDLSEQYVHKSRTWYWRQVLKGLPVSIVKEALGHKAIAARAIVAGCIAWLVFLSMYPSFVSASIEGPVLGFDILNAPPVLGAWAALANPIAVSLFLPTDSTLFRLWIQYALPFVAWAVCGWIVTRVDIGRTHRGLAPLFAGFVLLLNVVLGIPGLTWFVTEIRRNPVALTGAPFSIDTIDLVALTAANVVLAVFGILLGGSLRRTRGGETTALPSRR